MAENKNLMIKAEITATGNFDFELPPGVFLAQLVSANWAAITAGMKVSLSGDANHFADVSQPPGHSEAVAPTANMEPVVVRGSGVLRINVSAIGAVSLVLLVSASR